MIFRKVFYRKPSEQKTLDSKTDQFVGKIFTSKSDIFFREFHFKFLIFKEKVYFKIMPFKISTKSENYVVFPGTNWVGTVFSDVNFWSKSDFSIKIEFKNWVSGKYFSSAYDYSKCFVFEICRKEKFSIQNLTFRKFFFSNFHCAGKRLLQNLIPSFSKISVQNLIFNEKVCYKVMPFKISRQIQKPFIVRGANRFKTLFLKCDVLIEIWFLNKNWTQNLIFR